MSGRGPTPGEDAERYRNLFEGSQASLADMAARQAQALGRVGRLRSAIVSVLRKNFMELSAQAEANLGRRLSEIDDEILLAYLDAFTGTSSRGDQRATLQALGEAIAALGVPLRGDDPLVWVEQIHRHRQDLRHQQGRDIGGERIERTSPDARPSPAATPGRAPSPAQVTPPHERPPVARDTDATTPVERKPEERKGTDTRSERVEDDPPALRDVDDYWQWEQPPSLQDLFSDAGTGLGGLFADVETPVLWERGDVEDNATEWSPSPVKPRDRGEVGNDRTTSDTGDARRNGTVRPDEQTKSEKPKHRATRPGQPKDVVTQPATPVTPLAAPQESPHAEMTESTVKRSVLQPSENDVETAPATTTEPEPVAPAGRGPGSFDGAGAVHSVVPVAPRPADIGSQPLRPELFPAASAPKKPRKGGRTVRTQANTPADVVSLIDAVTDGGDQATLDDPLRHALLAAASIPRPVFTRDLIAVAGNVELVDAWEAECRTNISTSPVRFVVPKSRHRLRGRLVAVEQDTIRPTDWWYQAVGRYRAGRLYELGVLLHRVGDEVVSFQLEEHVALFRLNTPKGLIALIVCLESRLDEVTEARTQLADALDKLLAERLTMLTVLSASAEHGALEQLVTVVEAISREREFAPTFPVLAARSWEYADDRGSSAVLVHGDA